MADEVTASKAATKKSAPKEIDHFGEINKALDTARDAMVASGMSVDDANAFLNSARPRGGPNPGVVGNFADLQRMGAIQATGTLPTPSNVPDEETTDIADAFVSDPKGNAPDPSEDRLAFAHKIDADIPVPEPTEARARELKASAAVAAAAEKSAK